MILFYDTETTGMIRKDLPMGHQHQPHIVQLGAILSDGLDSAAEVNILVKPDGFTIPEEATKIHGITQLRAHDFGLPLAGAISIFHHLASNSELIVGYNVDYDHQVMEGEFMRKSRAFPDVETFCVMRAMTPICKIPSQYRAGDYKWPKLAEAYLFAFKEPLVDAHDAMADVKATMLLYYWLQNPVAAALPVSMTADEIHEDAQAGEDAMTP